eukprot:479679_1
MANDNPDLSKHLTFQLGGNENKCKNCGQFHSKIKEAHCKIKAFQSSIPKNTEDTGKKLMNQNKSVKHLVVGVSNIGFAAATFKDLEDLKKHIPEENKAAHKKLNVIQKNQIDHIILNTLNILRIGWQYIKTWIDPTTQFIKNINQTVHDINASYKILTNMIHDVIKSFQDRKYIQLICNLVQIALSLLRIFNVATNRIC